MLRGSGRRGPRAGTGALVAQARRRENGGQPAFPAGPKLRGRAAGGAPADGSGAASVADFAALAQTWREETVYLSSTTAIVSHPAYRKIVAMGRAALPLVLAELRRERDDPAYWFGALRAITGENPVPESDRGDTARMADAWLRWADDRGVR